MKKVLVLLLMTVLLFTGGCGKTPAESGFEILTSFYPIYILTLNVTKDVEDVSVSVMASQQSGCLHDYQLSTTDMRAISSADVFIINGGGMESFLDKVTESLGDTAILTATENVAFLSSDHGVNGHCWLSPSRAAQMVLHIADELSRLDPDHQAQYQDNAVRYILELNALSQEMKSAFSSAEQKKVISFHEGFAYLFEETGIEAILTLETDHGTELSAKELSEAALTAKENKGCPLLTDTVTNNAAATVARETGLTPYILDPFTSGEETPTAYLDAMRENLTTLKGALSVE